MIRPEDWARMPWHAREKYLRRNRPKPEPKVQKPQSPKKPRLLSEHGISRCGCCGGWMYHACKVCA